MINEQPAPLSPELESLLNDLLHLHPQYDEMVRQLQRCSEIANGFSPDERGQIKATALPRMTDPTLEPDPYRRAALGRVLGLLDLDDRKGIGVTASGLPDIDWVDIPEGAFPYQKQALVFLPQYRISRYHITWKQFQVFLDAEDGFVDPRWWDGLAERKERYTIQQEKPTQVFRFWNHPFDGACWYDAIAFCRWWSYRLGGEYRVERAPAWKVRLPTEQEWEKAAAGTDGRKYPWGDTFCSGCANFDETDRYNIQQDQAGVRRGQVGTYYYAAPTAPGIFPHGASPYGVMDMIGTMWDLTLTEYRHGKNDDLYDYYPRVIRGGTWFVSEMYCENHQRNMLSPQARTNGDLRKNDYGFRVMTSAV